MNNTAKIIGATVLGLGIAVALPVLGHGYGYGGGMHGPYGGGYGPGHMMGFGGMHEGRGYFGANIEQQLSDVKKSLELTTEQQTAWDQYEQAVKALAANKPWENSGTNMANHFDQMQAHFTQMKTVYDAQQTLYSTLTQQQKATFDNLMPGPFGHHWGFMDQ